MAVGRGSEAVAVLKAGASIDGSALKDRKVHETARVQALVQLGSLYAEQGRPHKALASYRQALKMLPEHYPPQVSLSYFYLLFVLFIFFFKWVGN